MINLRSGARGLTYKRLKEVLECNPATGLMFWKHRQGRCIRTISGQVAGYLHNDGYYRIKIDGIKEAQVSYQNFAKKVFGKFLPC
jgi:hypothetical protein